MKLVITMSRRFGTGASIIADELSKKIAEVMQSVLKISVPFVVEVGQGQNWDAAH